MRLPCILVPIMLMPSSKPACCRSMWQQALARLPWTPAARALALQKNIGELWARQQSDDLLYIFLSVIDAYITKARQACPKAPLSWTLLLIAGRAVGARKLRPKHLGVMSWTLLHNCREGCGH